MIDQVTEYAKSCLENRVVIGEFTGVAMGDLHKQACKRHLEDLEKSTDPDFPYYWDVEASEKVLKFAGMLTIKEGFEAKPLELLDCQKFDFGCTMGWKKKKNGMRRFRRRYKSIARQNGKTMENGILGPYISAFSGYKEGKLFTAATNRRQARLAWEEMKKFISVDPDLAELFDIKDYKSTILCKPSGCTIEALSKEGGLQDGFRSIFCSLDELHQQKDNSVYEAVYKGTKALPETLVSMISTRGKDQNSFAKEIDDFAVKILSGAVSADDFFVDIYAADDGDDPYDVKTLIKANPFICSRGDLLENLENDAATAKEMGGQTLKDYIVKTLNQWTIDEDSQFVSAADWTECEVEETLDDYAGAKCWLGIDFSSGGDLCSYSLEVQTDRPGKYFVHSHSYMPRGRMDEHVQTDLAPYDIWEKQGLITVTGGRTSYKNDYGFMVRDIRELIEKYSLKLQGIGIDPHNADGVLGDLESFGVPVLIITQSAKSLNDATVEIQLDIKSKNYLHNRDQELLSWSFLNAAVVANSFGEIKVDKEPGKRTRRIDPVDAAVDARACRMRLAKEEEPVDMADHMNRYLQAMGW